MAKDKHTIKVPLYHCTVHVCLTRDSYAKFTGDKELAEDKGIDGCTARSGNTHVVALFNHDADVIAHEMLHATFAILRQAGVTPSEDSEECYTYLLGFLIRELNKRMEKDKKHESTATIPPVLLPSV